MLFQLYEICTRVKLEISYNNIDGIGRSKLSLCTCYSRSWQHLECQNQHLIVARSDEINFHSRLNFVSSNQFNVQQKGIDDVHGRVWLFLCEINDSLLDQYFHFIEYLSGMWPVHVFTAIEDVQLVEFAVMGPNKTKIGWDGTGTNGKILHSLFPNVNTVYEGGHSFSENKWIRMKRVVVGYRSASHSYNNHTNLGKFFNKMSMDVIAWALNRKVLFNQKV